MPILKTVNSLAMETIAQIPKYNLNEEQEKKLILREYRSLLRALKSRIKPGDRKLIRHAFEMAADAHKTTRRLRAFRVGRADPNAAPAYDSSGRGRTTSDLCLARNP